MMKNLSGTIFAALAVICAFPLAADEPVVYLDSVPDSLLDKELEEVVVTGKTPLIQAEADKVTYNMTEDASAQTATVIDALRKVPMLTVDADGNIKLKGERNFKIYFNGKPDPAISANYKDIFKAMPASIIKKVEVITDPGAKYDAEGVGGIINIVTESRTSLKGYTATVNLTATKNMLGGGINALGRIGNVSLNLNYNHNYGINNGIGQDQSVLYLNDPLQHELLAHSKLDIHNNMDFGSLQASWEPDSLNLFTVNANLFNVNVPVNTNIYYSMLNDKGQENWSYTARTRMKNRYFNYTLGANWQHNFRTPEHNIVFLYQYSRNNQRENRQYIYEDYVNYPGTIPSVHNQMYYPDNEHTFQFDYTLPFLKKYTLETGAKYIMRRNSGNTKEYNSPDGIDWTIDELNSVRMKQHQDVAAVYASWKGKFGSWTTLAGLRYEYTHLSTKFLTSGHKDFAQSLNDLVPNAMVSYSFPDYSSLNLAYQMRITRPGVEELNPFRKEDNPLSVSYGNPELISEKTNNVTLSYSNFILPVQMNISLGYSYADKLIQEYTFLGADNVAYTTYGNLGHRNQGSLFAYFAYPIISGMRLSVNGGVTYAAYKAVKVGVDNSGWGFNASADFNYQMPWDLELSAYGGLGKNAVDFQSSHSVWSYHGLALTKSLLPEKRMRITLSANNFATPTQHYTYKKVTPDMIAEVKGSFSSWNIGITVSYRIGSFNDRVKQTSKVILNDDVNQTSGSNSGTMPGGGRGVN